MGGGAGWQEGVACYFALIHLPDRDPLGVTQETFSGEDPEQNGRIFPGKPPGQNCSRCQMTISFSQVPCLCTSCEGNCPALT